MTEQKLDHEVIYLQSDEESISEERTWCEDNLNEDDTKYIRADIATTREAELQVEVRRNKKMIVIYQGDIAAFGRDSDKLQAEVVRLREALEVYASEKMWIVCEGGKRISVFWKNGSGGASSFGKLTHLWRGHVGESHPNEVAIEALNKEFKA